MLEFHVSTTNDGSMKSVNEHDFEDTKERRAAFLGRHNLTLADTTLVRLVYEGEDYCRYKTIDSSDKGDGVNRSSKIVSDALIVSEPGHALLLPLADCIAAVIHDPVKNILMLSHLGRHNLEQFGGKKSIEYLVATHGCDPKDLTVWLSPAAGSKNYPLFAFNNRGMHSVAGEQLMSAGVLEINISVSPIDVTTDQNYYSHSQFLKGNRPDDGRFAVVCVMR